MSIPEDRWTPTVSRLIYPRSLDKNYPRSVDISLRSVDSSGLLFLYS